MPCRHLILKTYSRRLKTMKISQLAILATLLAFLPGCATVMSGTTQRVNVKAIDSDTHKLLANAHCTLTDGDGQVHAINANPGSTVVTRGKGAISVTCEQKGWRESETAVGQSFNAWTVVNVLFWPGALVDAATGAIQKYPSHITVLMKKQKTVA